MIRAHYVDLERSDCAGRRIFPEYLDCRWRSRLPRMFSLSGRWTAPDLSDRHGSLYRYPDLRLVTLSRNVNVVVDPYWLLSLDTEDGFLFGSLSLLTTCHASESSGSQSLAHQDH